MNTAIQKVLIIGSRFCLVMVNGKIYTSECPFFVFVSGVSIADAHGCWSYLRARLFNSVTAEFMSEPYNANIEEE